MGTQSVAEETTERVFIREETQPIPPYIIQHRLGGWPSVAVTIYWQQYKRKTRHEYWVN